MNKFKILHLDRRQHLDIVINNKTIPTSREGTMLGLKITRTGYATHITETKNTCKREMARLWRLKDLGEKNKRKLFHVLISSRLHYPPIPTHCLAETSLKTLQRIQNQGARFITKIRRSERKTNEEVNRRANLVPLNQSLFARAAKIWNRIRTDMREEWAELLSIRPGRKKNFPLSIPVILNDLPPPILG